MADKYAHLSPRRYRACTRGDGIRKSPLTEDEAITRAAESTRDKGTPFHAYQCPICRWWHTAHTPRAQEDRPA